MNPTTISIAEFFIGLLVGAVSGVAYMHIRFVLKSDYEADQGRHEANYDYIRGRLDDVLDRLGSGHHGPPER